VDQEVRVPELRDEVERIARRSEVQAVAQAMKNGGEPRVGDVLDYTVDFPGPMRRLKARSKPYRFSVEAWHLAAAAALMGLHRRNPA
jgi:hypothetical protein